MVNPFSLHRLHYSSYSSRCLLLRIMDRHNPFRPAHSESTGTKSSEAGRKIGVPPFVEFIMSSSELAAAARCFARSRLPQKMSRGPGTNAQRQPLLQACAGQISKTGVPTTWRAACNHSSGVPLNHDLGCYHAWVGRLHISSCRPEGILMHTVRFASGE